MYIVIYAGGCYGQFVTFTLDWLQGNYSEDFRPFTPQGNAHDNNSPIRYDLQHALEDPVTNSHMHPIQEKDSMDDMHDVIDKLLGVYDQVVVLYPELTDFVWTCNNKLYKIRGPERWYKERLETNPNFKSLDNHEVWNMREWLSIQMWDHHKSETGHDVMIDYDNPKVYKFPVNKLRDDFTRTFNDLGTFLGLHNVRLNDQMDELHQDWLTNEKFIYKDRLIKELTDAIINDVDMEMHDLTLFDTAFIQRNLRLAGYEIECYGLNTWPTNTKQLRKLLYETKI